MRMALIGLLAVLFLRGGVAVAGDTFAWTPPRAPAVVRGRQVADRFDLLWTGQVTVTPDDAFSPGGRRTLFLLDRGLGKIPGVRQVLGPAGLLSLAVDGAGMVTARPLFGDDASAEGGQVDSESLRQQLGRRADAAGWFLAPDGRTARFLVESDDFDRARPAIARAVDAVGLKPAIDDGSYASSVLLWPDPRDRAVRWTPLLSVALWIAFLWLFGAPAWRSAGTLPPAGALAMMLAAALGAGCLFVLASLAPLRQLGARAIAVAVGATAVALIIERATHRPTGSSLRPCAVRVSPLTVAAAVLIAAAGALTVGRMRLGTQQWRAAPLLFVSVRGDVEQPVVLRELRRLTDFLRTLPGVAGTWSIADLFDGVDLPGDEVSRIPDQPDDVRRVLARARADSAARLELSGDHREALVVVRFETAGDVDRPALLDRLAQYLTSDFRPDLAPVDLREPLPPVTRAVGRGLLASDGAERILRICARAGRNLDDDERRAIVRVARRAALIPAADVGKLRGEVAAEVRAFLRLHAPALDAVQRERAAAALSNLDGDASSAAVRGALVAAFAPAHTPPALAGLAMLLARQLGEVRSRHSARIHAKDMLAGAGLPSEGPLADEVRGATRDTMGPIVGLPVGRDTPGALHLDAVVVGGAAHDQALSAAWLPGLRAGAFAGAVGLAIVLVLVAGFRGVLWYPVALALPSAALIVPALTRDPIGVLFVGFLAGTCAAGAVLAIALAARRVP
ncbi:MAG TPA: hypothetical protein VGL59_03555 [Polyangia bacterium]